MAAKVFFVLALVAAGAYAADNDCKCEPPSDSESSALWEFFQKLQSSELAESDDDSRLDAVIAGELSPLLDCNCLEKTQENSRRKRKVLPESADESVRDDYSDHSLNDRRTPMCPQGYAWYGILCVDERLVMDKK